MSGSWQQFCLAVLLIVFPVAFSTADEPSQGIDPSLIIEQFEVFNDGDSLIVPVELAGKRYMFVVDTGFSVSAYDTSLRSLLGDFRGSRRVVTFSGAAQIDFHDAPNARLGKLNIQSETPVICLDLQNTRRVSGYDIYGVIGMDVLDDHVIHLDSDHGKLTVLRSLGKPLGKPLTLTYRSQTPEVEFEIPLCGKRSYLVDTGSVCHQSGMVDSAVFNLSLKRGVSRRTSASLFVDANGKGIMRQALFERAFLGDFECRRIFMNESAELRHLSLRFLTRFNVTFDFRGGRLYLEKSRYFDRPDSVDLSGLHIVRRDGQVTVEVADKGSQAALSGCKTDDIILEVNGDDVANARLFTIREILSMRALPTVPVKLKRGDELFDVNVKLAEAKAEADDKKR